MALQDVQGAWVPEFTHNVVSSVADKLLDANGEKVAYILRVPKTGTLSHVKFRTGAVTVGDDITVSFQDVDMGGGASPGDPVESIDEWTVVEIGDDEDNDWIDVSDTAIMTDDGAGTGNKRSVTIGDYLAVVFEFQDWALEGDLNIRMAASGRLSTPILEAAYGTHKVGGSWTKDATSQPYLALVYDDGSLAYMPGAKSGYGESASFNEDSTPDERALHFELPMPCKTNGCVVFLDLDNPVSIVLYDADGTSALETITLDPDVRCSAAQGLIWVPWSTERTLAKDTAYRISIKPTSGVNVKYYFLRFDEAVDRAQHGGGVGFQLSTRVGAGEWSETDTEIPAIALSISALDDGVGGGGGLLVHPGMSGGMRA